jgi:glycosyltransferase involved in cell wall biosynthesis
MKFRMAAKEIILIVEPMLCAHSIGYFRAILQNEKLFAQYEILFAYANDTTIDADTLDPLRKEFGSKFQSRRIEVGESRISSGQFGELSRSFKILKKVIEIRNESRAQQIVVLNADSIVRLLGIPGLASVFKELKGRISGVFFNSRCFRESTVKSKILSRLVQRGMRSGVFKKLLFLDHGVIDHVRKIVGTSGVPIIGRAVDPWSSFPALVDVRPPDEGSGTLLLFGAHSRRKGTLLAMRMFEQFTDRLNNFKLLIAGPVRDDIREEFYELLGKLEATGADIEVIDRYFEDQESWGLFRRSDIVLCPYLDFHGSSNVIIRAAAFGLPVVGPDFGYLGELISEKDLGSIYQAQEPESLLTAVEDVARRLEEAPRSFKESCENYAEFHRESQYGPSLIQ